MEPESHIIPSKSSHQSKPDTHRRVSNRYDRTNFGAALHAIEQVMHGLGYNEHALKQSHVVQHLGNISHVGRQRGIIKEKRPSHRTVRLPA
jgi:hypothetical protein